MYNYAHTLPPSLPPSLHLGGLHELLPVAVSDGWVLQLPHGTQRCYHVLHQRVQPSKCVPCTHLLVQATDILGGTTVKLHSILAIFGLCT